MMIICIDIITTYMWLSVRVVKLLFKSLRALLWLNSRLYVH